MDKRLLTVSLSVILPLLQVVGVCAAEKSITGTLEDSFCYITMGAHGASHQNCAQECAKKGIPVTLIEKGTGTAYVLLPPKNNEPIPDSVISRMEREVTVTGDEYEKAGTHYLTVKAIK
jgi:hypothetical protein